MSAAVWWSSHSNRQIGVVAGAAMGGNVGGIVATPRFGGNNTEWMGRVGGYSPVGAVGSGGRRNGHLREIGAVGGADVFI